MFSIHVPRIREIFRCCISSKSKLQTSLQIIIKTKLKVQTILSSPKITTRYSLVDETLRHFHTYEAQASRQTQNSVPVEHNHDGCLSLTYDERCGSPAAGVRSEDREASVAEEPQRWRWPLLRATPTTHNVLIVKYTERGKAIP